MMVTSKDALSNTTELMLSVMLLQEETGLLRGLASFIRRNDQTIRQLASPEQLSTYEEILRRAEAAFDLERRDGSGSLLKLGHPFTRMLILTGVVDVRHLIESAPPAVGTIHSLAA